MEEIKAPNNLSKFISQTEIDKILQGVSQMIRDDAEECIKRKYPTMDALMNVYMERADSGDAMCLDVFMDDGKRINFSQQPRDDEVIFTYGLCGCVATGLVLEMKDGSQKAILTHSSPLATEKGSRSILRLGADINPEEVKQAKVFILAPGEYKKNAEGRWEHEITSQYTHHTTLLEMSAKYVGGNQVQVQRIPYSMSTMFGAKNQGVFRIVKAKDGKLRYIVEEGYISGEVFD